MAHLNDDPDSDVEKNLEKRTQRRCQSNVLIIKEVENSEEGAGSMKLHDITGKTRGVGVQQRWVFAVMGCLAVTNALMMRVCLSLAMTEMVSKAETASNHTSSDGTCPATTESMSPSSRRGGTYEWSEYTQGIILSSFFWGYIITQLPGGLLAEKFGGKYTLGIGIFSTAILTLLTPPIVQAYGSTGLIILRVFLGIGEGTTIPALTVLISEWAPPLERSKIGAMVMSGMSLGTVVGNALTGVLIQYSSIGWPMVFYVLGLLGVLWFLLWVLLCYNNPEVHPFISEEEKKYLHETMNYHTRRKTQPPPWRYILASGPVWALIIGKIGVAWGGQTMSADLPKYMSSVLKFSIGMNGILSALASVSTWLMGNASSWLADWLIKTDKVSRKNIRKILNSTGLVIPAIFLLAASYTGCDRTVVMILFTVGMAMMGMKYSSVMVNPNDLSTNYSGTLMAMVNAVGAIVGVLVPYVIGVLTPNQTLLEWRVVFWITFVILCTCALIFNLWADGEVQHWNDLDLQVDQTKEIESSDESAKIYL